MTNKLNINVNPGLKLLIDEKLMDILGMMSGEIIGSHVPDKCINLHVNDSLLYIYTDIIPRTVYGDRSCGLLKIINGHEGDFDHLIYDNTQSEWVRVNIDNFDVIRIQIRDKSGSLIKVQEGHVTIQLVLRRL